MPKRAIVSAASSSGISGVPVTTGDEACPDAATEPSWPSATTLDRDVAVGDEADERAVGAGQEHRADVALAHDLGDLADRRRAAAR